MMQDELNPLEKKHSRFIARALRHHPETIGIKLDKHGWADVEALLNGCKAHGHDIDRAGLERIVELNDKKRFAFSEDGSMIRALQGHSIAVDVGLKKAIPPMKLYHGTVEQNAQSIAKKGLLPMKRLYVHLSPDAGTARPHAALVLAVRGRLSSMRSIRMRCSRISWNSSNPRTACGSRKLYPRSI